MQIRQLLLLFSLFGSLFSMAQINGIVRGTVKDKNTQETIIGAIISIDGSTTGAITDIEGNYKLSLPVGTYNLKASFLGYTTLIQYNISITSGNAQNINF